MAWWNPYSWGGGPDEVDYSRLQGMNKRFEQFGQQQAQELRGISSGITPQDQQMYGQSFGFMRDLVMDQLRSTMPGILASQSGQAGARNLSGSATEQGLRQRALLAGQRQAGEVLQGFGAQQAGQMQQGAATRFGQEMSRNQQLWQNLMQAYMPSYQTEQGRVSQEEQRIAQEKASFGGLVGGVAGLFAPGIGNIIGGRPWGYQPPTPTAKG